MNFWFFPTLRKSIPTQGTLRNKDSEIGNKEVDRRQVTRSVYAPLTDWFGGIANHFCTWRYVFCHDCAGPDNCAVADRHAG